MMRWKRKVEEALKIAPMQMMPRGLWRPAGPAKAFPWIDQLTPGPLAEPQLTWNGVPLGEVSQTSTHYFLSRGFNSRHVRSCGFMGLLIFKVF